MCVYKMHLSFLLGKCHAQSACVLSSDSPGRMSGTMILTLAGHKRGTYPVFSGEVTGRKFWGCDVVQNVVTRQDGNSLVGIDRQ